MNADQRKYLTRQVERTYDNQDDALRRQIGDAPSLNNYIISAFLDGSIKMHDVDGLKEKIRERVLKLGTDSKLIIKSERDSWTRGNKFNRDYEEHLIVNIEASDIFVIPESYKKVRDEYESRKERLEKEMSELRAVRDTILLKINVGSSKSLDSLVMQIDTMSDINVVNSQLLLGDNSKSKNKDS